MAKIKSYHQFSLEELEELLVYFSNSIIDKQSEEEVAWDIAKNCISKLGFVDCVIYFIDHKRKLLVQKAAYGSKNPRGKEIYNPITIPLNTGITGTVAVTGVAEIIPDTSLDTRYIVDDQPRLSEITVPIMMKKKVIGIIDCEHPYRGFFTRQHLKILTAIASICAVKLSWIRAEKKIHQKEQRLLRARQEMAQMKMQALYAQMNPHFIFNSLNAIQDSVLANQNRVAIKYLGDFSLLLRRILNNANRNFISLADEIQSLCLYLKLESIRFENSFSWHLNIDEQLSPDHIDIPPMLIQPFVEHALWHRLLPKNKDRSLILSFFFQRNRLLCTIEDNGISRLQKANHKPDTEGKILAEERVFLLNSAFKIDARVAMEDIFSENKEPKGTRVEISFNYNTLSKYS